MAALIAKGKIGGWGMSEVSPTTLRRVVPRSLSALGMPSSPRSWVEAGRTQPQSRLTATSASPRPMSFFLGQMISSNAFRSLAPEIFVDLGLDTWVPTLPRLG